MTSLLKSRSTLGRSLRTGAAALMLGGLLFGAAAAPASANWHGGGWHGGGWRGGWGGWLGGWGWHAGWYGRPWYGYPGVYGYVAPPVVYAAPVPGVGIAVVP